MTTVFELQQGSIPLLVSMPHIGTQIPDALHHEYVPRALATEDADWHLRELYDFVPLMGASRITPTLSRYVIDLNRPPDDAPMYPGASNTELCPTHFFNGDKLYLPDREPAPAVRAQRRSDYWLPYHEALANEIARIKDVHGFVLLWDAHSIRSEIPWLFEGRLPDLNIGTASGASADDTIAQAMVSACKDVPGVTSILNGRFKGGYITRHYGNPAQHVHAVQLEMCQSTYMQEVAPYAYDPALAARIQPVIANMMGAALDACRALYAR
ncbi:MAG: N-formylglutamate deformylase [Comamonadaceae bacterium]|nr:MAG: N-formylglutamate deformylase [Comamonadaceae bacterium]